MVILGLGLIAAFAMAAWIGHRNAAIAAARFDAAARRVAMQIEGRLATYEYGLRGARGAIVAAGEDRIDREAFRRYAESRDIDHEFPGSRGFGFIRRVPRDAEARFVSQASLDGQPGFRIRQLAEHDGERFVIQYIEPVARNREAVGLDVASEEHRRSAAIRAMETGEATATAPVTLVQATGLKARGFLVFLPVVRTDARPRTVEERRAVTIGWSYAPLIIDEVLAGLSLDGDELDFSLTDLGQANSIVFYPGKAMDQLGQAGLVRRLPLSIFGRGWELDVRARPQFVKALNFLSPPLAACAVFLGFLLVAGLAYLHLRGKRREVLAGVERSRLAAIVENANDAIIGTTLAGVVTDWNPAAERLFGIPAGEAIGRPAGGLIVPEDLRGEDEEMLARIRQGLPTPPISTFRLRRDGGRLPMQVGVSPIRTRGGGIGGAAIMARDVSEHVIAAENIRRLNATLEQQVAERTAQLQKSSALQAAILNHAGYAVIATDAGGTITLFNPAAERMLGYEAGELIGRATPAAFHDPEEVAARAPLLSAELGTTIEPGFEVFVARTKRGLPDIDEWTYIRKDGRRLPILLNVNHLRSEDGADLGFLGIALDLSERYTHKAQMKAANAGSWSYDVAAGRVMLSPEAARQHGLPEAEIEIDVDTQWRPLVHPADIDRVLASLEAAIASLGTYETEFRVPQPDGSLRWITAIGRVEADASGAGARVVGLTLDVTARKEAEHALRESEQRYRMLAENTVDMIVQTDMDAVHRYVSPASRRMLGYEPDDLIGGTPFDILHPDDEPAVRALIRDLMDGRGEAAVQRQRYRRKDGDYVWVEVTYQLFHAADGEPIGCMACARDISRQHADAETLQEAKQAAERANAAKTDFLASMSHEIRTPLNAIIGFTDLMVGSGRLPPDLEHQAQLVRSSGATLLAVVNDILDFSKVEAGAIELERQPFVPAALIDDCASIVRSLAVAKGLALRISVDPQLPAGLVGDQARLRQILFNLLNNAVKFTRVGSVTLGVRHEGTAGVGERLRFSVTDTGIGIPKDKQHRLFQRFSQVDSSIQRDFGGTGLGLAICKKLVDLMDGEIGVHSDDSQGSTFWFTLTLPRAFLPQELRNVTEAPAARKRGHILLVEDVAINQELARVVLEVAGHTVDVVDDGAAAVMAVDEGAYDLVLMDVQMPGMDGMTATRMIRRLRSGMARVPVIAMTANVLPDQVRAFREAGMDDHVGKPFNRAELYATIDKWLPDTPSLPVADLPATDNKPTGFDQATYDAIVALLPPERLVRVLTSLTDELTTSFSDAVTSPEDRRRVRHKAHALAAAAGMVGFLGLSEAGRALDVYDEARVVAGGLDEFEARLTQVREQAAAALIRTRKLIQDHADQPGAARQNRASV